MKTFIKIFFVLSLLIVLTSTDKAPKEDLNLCKSIIQVNGIKVFIGSLPSAPYEGIGSLPITVSWRGDAIKSLSTAIKKCQNKNPHFNGMIIYLSNMNNAELIKFKGTTIRRGGFGIGDKVSFVYTGHTYSGSVVQLWPDKATVSYIDNGNRDKTKKIYYKKLVLIKKADND